MIDFVWSRPEDTSGLDQTYRIARAKMQTIKSFLLTRAPDELSIRPKNRSLIPH